MAWMLAFSKIYVEILADIRVLRWWGNKCVMALSRDWAHCRRESAHVAYTFSPIFLACYDAERRNLPNSSTLTLHTSLNPVLSFINHLICGILLQQHKTDGSCYKSKTKRNETKTRTTENGDARNVVKTIKSCSCCGKQ